jgi:uncharacterized alkaline shock family protein YloU
VEVMTGKPVSKIDVIIEGIAMDQSKDSDSDWSSSSPPVTD